MLKLTRRDFLGTAAASVAWAAAGGAQAPARRPNVVFILADDLGYGDLSSFGRPEYQTPVLDGLAKQGMKFTSAYAAAPVCTPTRCSFLTGRYPQRLRVGLEEPLTIRSGADVGLPPGHPTIASLMKASGYSTALYGKWHLGWKPEFGPTRHGFDEFFGPLSGATDYFTHRSADMPGGNAAEGGGADLWENETPVQRNGYLTDLLTDKAVEFINKRRTNPFYLSLHYNAPHSPWEGPDDAGINHAAHGPGPMAAGGSLKTYAAMMRRMDEGIGRVLKALERDRADRNTLVIFTSDNGGERFSYNWPFSGEKLDLREGGTRVPAIARWTGMIPAGRVTDQAAITMDWTATILALAGATADPAYPLDGENLMPVLTGQRPAYDRTLFWRIRGSDAMRSGSLKYLKDETGDHLFDVVNDPGEKVELGTLQPDRMNALKAQFQQWAGTMLPLT